MIRAHLLSCLFVSLAVLTAAQSAVDRAKAMLQKMSLEEKINMLHGNKTRYTGGTPEIVNAKTGVRIPVLLLLCY